MIYKTNIKQNNNNDNNFKLGANNKIFIHILTVIKYADTVYSQCHH